MGESAVLFHSYSFAAPLSRHESHQDNTIRALSQSVSFGRFMTENLEWGKWSSFSHKKYVDEAEKFSQPGSVAQKKAFFDAHYKKIAEAKKAKVASDDSKQQHPESVAVLLNTLETLTKEEVKEEEESGETELVLGGEEVVLRTEKNEEEAVVVLEQEEAVVDNSMIADDLQAVLEVLDENHTEDVELLKKSSSVGENEDERKSLTKNSPVVPMDKSEAPEKAMELVVSQKISEKPITHISTKKNKFSFLNFLMGNTKTQDQNPKRKTDKKGNKMFLCLCFNPEMVKEIEGPTKTQRRNL